MIEGAGRAFDHCLGCLISPATTRLAAHLASLPGLDEIERAAIMAAVREALLDTLHRRLVRLLVLELNIARDEGRLDGETSEARWGDFVTGAATHAFWQSAFVTYPALASRIDRIIENQISAAHSLASDWVSDRGVLAPLLDMPAATLRGLRFSQGDRHGGGRTVAIVDTDAGPIVYKPRSLAVDMVLAAFLERLNRYGPLSLQVALVIDRGDHGWARHVPHRLASSDAELSAFYRGIGEALSVMRVLGGTDLHGENLIACGSSPILIDCETLFTPNVRPFASLYGKAHDRASALVGESVLAIGLLPDRAQGLGWRGIDMSGVGGLPDQQPETMVPGLVDAGTDRARIALVAARNPRSANHPAETPRLADFWPDVLSGYDEVTARLRKMDAVGELEPLLSDFADCPTRVVVRPTETYAELGRMLWHPVSLGDEVAAIERATSVLAGMAGNFSYAPSDPDVIAAEVDDLLAGDIPMFTTTPASGELRGPGDTRWLASRNLVTDTLRDWRSADDVAERDFIRAALVSAYVNDGFLGDGSPRRANKARRDDLDRRRRTQAARIMEGLLRSAHRGSDDTVSWVAPILSPSGWRVQPLGPDLYAGLSGLALVTGAYARETSAGRADPVPGVSDLYARLLNSLRRWEQEQYLERVEAREVRPPSVGGYVGLGSQIWTRLSLRVLGMDDDRAIADALRIAEGVSWAEAGDDRDDLLYGRAGAIPPLLKLAALSGEDWPLAIARKLGDAVCEAASRDDAGRACWVHAQFPNGVGGFAHGVSGIGWALSRLADATGCDWYAQTASAAFAFENDLWDPEEEHWRDLRNLDGVASSAAWCHGTVGIALARIDLDPQSVRSDTSETLDRAVRGTQAVGFGWNHCLCHGDFGAWELYDHAIRLGRSSPGFDAEGLRAELVGGLEEHGPLCGVTRDALSPGLFTGTAGIAYQLLRMHPEADLPSPLTLQ